MKLPSESIRWALSSIVRNSDSDLFPPTPEFRALEQSGNSFIERVASLELKDLRAHPSNRFLVPKDRLSYRQATQLHPMDAVTFTAIVHAFGSGIERRRLDSGRVFSYRFAPSADGLYDESIGWREFWRDGINRASGAAFVLYCDIADFYNQIYHHTIENQLAESGLPNQATKWILELFKSTTASVSRGIPIGPHASHLIAEASMIPIDNSLVSSGLRHTRFVDDVLIFCDSEEEAQRNLFVVAQTLDRQQRLILQRHKTRIFARSEFLNHAHLMTHDQPISETEASLLAVVRKYSGGNPYRSVLINDVSTEDWKTISDAGFSAILESYLSSAHVDYSRLAWFYRRLAQVGHPGALGATLDRVTVLTPCLASVVSYISSIQDLPTHRWLELGQRLIDLLDVAPLNASEYYQASIVGAIARSGSMNHFEGLARRFETSSAAVKRQILLAAVWHRATDWLRERKEDFRSFDAFSRLAFLYAVRSLPQDERKFFLRNHATEMADPVEATLIGRAR